MSKISYSRHRFPPAVNHRSVWLNFRFPLNFRDVEEVLAERGIDVSYETVRRWVLKFGPAIVANIKSNRPRPSEMQNLDQVFARIRGKRAYLWRAIDDEDEALEVLSHPRRNKCAALKLMWKLLRKQGYIPDAITTEKLDTYSAALRELGLAHLHVTGDRLADRVKVLRRAARRRERQMSPSFMAMTLHVPHHLA